MLRNHKKRSDRVSTLIMALICIALFVWAGYACFKPGGAWDHNMAQWSGKN